MQIGRRMMLRVLGLMGLGFLFRRLGAEDAYASATPTPTPAPMQAVFDAGKAVHTILVRLTSHNDGNTWYDNDPNKGHATLVHGRLKGWETSSRPSTYDDLAKDLDKIIKDLDVVEIHTTPAHGKPKLCTGKTDIALVRCQMDAVYMLLLQDYDRLKALHNSGAPTLDPAPDPSIPDDKAIIALSKYVTNAVTEIEKLLDGFHLSSKTPVNVPLTESKDKDS